jgi:hypothetical protein
MIAGCARCCSKDTLAGDSAALGAALGQWTRREGVRGECGESITAERG